MNNTVKIREKDLFKATKCFDGGNSHVRGTRVMDVHFSDHILTDSSKHKITIFLN